MGTTCVPATLLPNAFLKSSSRKSTVRLTDLHGGETEPCSQGHPSPAHAVANAFISARDFCHFCYVSLK